MNVFVGGVNLVSWLVVLLWLLVGLVDCVSVVWYLFDGVQCWQWFVCCVGECVSWRLVFYCGWWVWLVVVVVVGVWLVGYGYGFVFVWLIGVRSWYWVGFGYYVGRYWLVGVGSWFCFG